MSVSEIKAPHLLNIQCPAELREQAGWLMWRYVQAEGEAKPRKLPYYTNGSPRRGQHGRAEDRKHLTTFQAARTAAARRGFDGVGFCPLQGFDIAALDLDDCLLPSGELHPEAVALIAGTYAEYSPSGRGIRAFFLGDLGNHKDSPGDPFGFETFSSNGFVTFTGNALPGSDLLGVQAVPQTLRAYCTRRFGARHAEPEHPLMADAPIGLTPAQLAEALDVLPNDLPYEASKGPSWLGVGMALHHETGGSGAGFELWDQWSQASPKYSTDTYGRKRWESFGRGGQRPSTARSLLRWSGQYGGRVSAGAVASISEFEAIESTPAERGPEKAPRFPVQPAGAFSLGRHPGWLVKGLIPRAELVVGYGESGAGKSFVFLDVAMAVSQGEPWRGLRVRQGRVVWIAAEGAGGFRARLQAYGRQHAVDLDALPFGVIDAAPNFLLKQDALDLARSVIEAGGADLVVVDTTAQVMPGANENASEDMGKVIAHCKGIHRATGATVLLIHHAGKDHARGARGWSGLKAAADAELEVRRLPGGRVLRNSKQKDGQDGQCWGFALEVVPVGVDEDGDVIDSCVAIDAPVPAEGGTGAAARKRGVWEDRVLQVLSERAVGQFAGIEIDALLADVITLADKPDGRDTRKQQASRALNRVLDEPDGRYLLEDDGTVSVL